MSLFTNLLIKYLLDYNNLTIDKYNINHFKGIMV